MKYYIMAISVALITTACSSTKKAETTAPAEKPAAKAAATKETKATAKSAAKETTAAEGSSVSVCTYGEVKREIKINQAADKCTVEYVKDGNTQEIASGASQSSFCGEIADRVKNNLTTAGYKCE